MSLKGRRTAMGCLTRPNLSRSAKYQVAHHPLEKAPPHWQGKAMRKAKTSHRLANWRGTAPRWHTQCQCVSLSLRFWGKQGSSNPNCSVQTSLQDSPPERSVPWDSTGAPANPCRLLHSVVLRAARSELCSLLRLPP